MRGVNFTAYQKRRALKYWLEEKMPIEKVCQKCKCTERSLWRWKKAFDGTLESLEPKSCRPITPHPNAHKPDEVECIMKVLKTKPDISYNEAYGILRQKHAYTRTYCGFYSYVIRHNLRPKKELDVYVPKPYETPEMLGTKWQMDVKYVPKECFVGESAFGERKRFYQYTMIDEATRERFLFPYECFGAEITVDFVKRAIAYFGYAPERIQTDNGGEFTNVKKEGQKEPVKHGLDIFLEKIKVKHQLIRAYTPRLNGKVERSHRSDQEAFYNSLKFKTYEELKKKMMKWNIRYNNRPHASLRNREGKKVWWTPLEKREDLLKLLVEKRDEYFVRFIKVPKTIKQVYAVA